MSKYNYGASIPISSIPESEMEQVIKEWAEGDEELEKLLLTCRANGIETTGCHAGEGAYISITVNKSHDKIRKMLHSIQTFPDIEVFITPNGATNVMATEEWDKPSILFGISSGERETVDSFFRTLSESIIRDEPNPSLEMNAFDNMLDFYDFFVGKEAETNFRLEYINGQYIFSVEPYKRDDLRSLRSLFEQAGLTKNIDFDGPHDNWQLIVATLEELSEKLTKCKDVIINEWPLSLPSEIVPGMSENAFAHYMKRKFGDSIEGQEQFKEWLENYRRETRERFFGSISNVGDGASLEGIKEEITIIEKNNKNIEKDNKEVEGTEPDDD